MAGLSAVEPERSGCVGDLEGPLRDFGCVGGDRHEAGVNAGDGGNHLSAWGCEGRLSDGLKRSKVSK